MKKYLLSGLFIAVILSGCNTSRLVSYTDDVYADPAEEKEKNRLARIEKAKTDSILNKQKEDALLAEEAKKPVNPYYKDVEYNSDDYYDYQYASRINRFHSPLLGAGYYDPFYTNCYTYNQNPLMYGTSIYSTYNYWMPSNQFGIYNNSMAMGFNNCWNCNTWPYNNYSYWNQPYYNSWAYDPYGWNMNPYWQYGYVYPNAYYGGWNNSFNNWNIGNWGYFNSFDSNSGYSTVNVGPRGSNGGFNNSSRSSADAQMRPEANATQQYIQTVNEQQSARARFTSIGTRMSRTNSAMRNEESGASSREAANIRNQGVNSSTRVTRQNTNTTQQNTNSSRESNANNNESNGRSNRMTRRASESNTNSEQTKTNFFNRENSNQNSNQNNNYTPPPSNSGNENRGGGGGSGSSPRGGGGGRPR